LYQGVFNKGRGLERLIETFSFLPSNFHLVIIGYGVLENELRKQTTALGLENVHFLGKVIYDDLHSYTRTADLGIFLLESMNLSKKLSSANKIFEYMKAGLPILTTNQPENRYIINSCNCGVLIDSIMPKEVAKNIIKIFDNPSEYQKMSENSKKSFLEKYNWGKEKQKLENLFAEFR